MKSRRNGRRKGSRNKGYFYRKGRGWQAKEGSQFFPLLDENGARLRDRSTAAEVVKEAFGRWQASRKQRPVVQDTATVLAVCAAYLAKAREVKGENKTFRDRAETLFDLCYGLPGKFRGTDLTVKGKPTKADKIHAGIGGLSVGELTPLHIDQWLQAHPTWNGGKRTRIQAIKRALNYGVESRMIAVNPIRGYKTPKGKARVTYIDPEQEVALIAAAKPALAQAIKVLIRTGMRPGCEFAALTAQHVKDTGERIEVSFQPHESKNRKLRTIRIADPGILAIIRDQIHQFPEGPIFRTSTGKPWTEHNISLRFRTLKRKLEKQGVKFDADTCAYSMRHTFAKRILNGYWTGKSTNIETLAYLMGNTPQVCRENYLNWDESRNEFLWQVA